MNRNCAINEIRDKIIEAYNVGKTSASLLKPNKIILPIGSEKLKTKDQTNEWARRVKKDLDNTFQAKFYGSLVQIDNNSNPNGTIVDITIPSKLIDAYEKKYGTQTTMFSLSEETVNKKNELSSRIKTLLDDYAKVNNIKVEFFETAINELDPVALWDSVSRVIKININKADLETFPEELAHHLTLALGDEHILVKRSLNLISRLNYKEILGKEYVDAYNNDDNLLKHEFLGKLIAKQIANTMLPNELNSEDGIKLWETIKNLLKAFIKLFNPNSNIENELDSLSKQLSNYILTGKKINEVDSLNLTLYSLDNKTKVLDKKIRPEYVYYSQLSGKLKNTLKKLTVDSKEYDETKAKIEKIESSLKELLENNNKQALLNLANETLDEIESYLDGLEQVINSGNKPNVNNIDKTVKVLHTLENLVGVKDRVSGLLEITMKYAKTYILDEMNSVTGKEFDETIFNTVDTDISALEANFSTLADIKNYLAKTIGLLIKKAQNIIEINNKKSFTKVKEAVDKLTTYQNSKGLKGDSIYDTFIQEYNGTLTLTKPYTTEFYNEISKSFKMKPDEGKAFRNKIATYDSINRQFKPRDSKYVNNNYKIIQNTKELKEFYDFFQREINEIKSKLPKQYSDKISSDFIPNIVEQSLLDILKSDKNITGKMKDSINYMLEISEGKQSGLLLDEELIKDEVPVKYVGKISSEVKSKDLGSSLLKFMYFTNSYEQMTEILPKTRLFQEVIKEQDFIKSTNKNRTINGEESNLNKIVDGFIKMQVLGESKKEEKYAPHIDFMLKYTSLLRIGLNPFNAITNAVIGNIGNLIEAIGGKHFNTKDYLKAIKIFSAENMVEDSKLNKISALFNPLMELEDYTNLEKINVGSNEYKDKIKSLMYLPQRMGEKQMQTSTMIALLLHTKVKTKDGNIINMWDAFDEKGEWKVELMGEKLDDNTIFKTTNKIHRINQMIHGRYSAKDSAILQQYSLFRSVFQFKKWIPAAIESRFGSERFDERLDMTIEGRYRTYVKGFKLMIAKLQSDIESIEKYTFNETDLYNMRKNYTELTLILATILAGVGFEDDKKRKDPSYKFMINQLNQISGDLLYFYNPKALTDPAKLSIPMLKTMQDLFKVIQYSPSIITGDKFKRGSKKDENKFVGSLLSVIPVVKPVVDVARLWNKDSYIKK
jgi:hypothetical protein